MDWRRVVSEGHSRCWRSNLSPCSPSQFLLPRKNHSMVTRCTVLCPRPMDNRVLWSNICKELRVWMCGLNHHESDKMLTFMSQQNRPKNLKDSSTASEWNILL